MSKVNEIVNRINSHYVRDDCVQVMIPYKDCITVIDEFGIMYHAMEGSALYINKYLEDNRKYWFPYANIPIHCSKMGMFNKCWFTNQILDFEKPYIRILDGQIIESFVIKDADGALIVDKNLTGNKRSEFMDRENLEIFLGNSTLCSENIYFIFLDGSIMVDEKDEIAHRYKIKSEDSVFEDVKEKLEKNVYDLKKYVNDNPNSTVGNYFYNNPYFLKFVEQQLKNFNDIDFPVFINQNNVPFLMIKTNGSNISIHKISIYFVGRDKYRVDIVDIPISKYALIGIEHLKYVSKIGTFGEPKIPLRLNPGVTREDKSIAKKRVKSIRDSLG